MVNKHTSRFLLVIAICLCSPQSPAKNNRDILTIADEARDTAVRLRGLTVLQPIRTKVASRKEIERYMAQRVNDPVIRKSLAISGAALSVLGVIPDGYDLEAFLARMAREQVAGYWDFERKILYIADWLPAYLQKPTLVHEFTHALQDQHYNIARFMKPVRGLSEPYSAIAALLEGDATVVMVESMMSNVLEAEDGERISRLVERLSGILSLASGLSDVPAVLRDSLMFPYFGGLRFVLLTRSNDGWESVNALYRTPPLSTEQVLHPEKRGKDFPVEVKLPSIRMPGYKKIGTDVMGELGIKLVLEQTLAKEDAARAAEGWGGDRYIVWASKGKVTMLWVSVWDSEADALEAEIALSKTKNPPGRLTRRDDIVAGVWGAVEHADSAIETAMKALIRTRVQNLGEWEKIVSAYH